MKFIKRHCFIYLIIVFIACGSGTNVATSASAIPEAKSNVINPTVTKKEPTVIPTAVPTSIPKLVLPQTTLSQPQKVVAIPTVDTLQIEIDEYVSEIGDILDDLDGELDDYEKGTDTPSFMDAEMALHKKRRQAEDSQRTFKSIQSSVGRLTPPNSTNHKQFHNELKNCLQALIRGNESRIDYYKEIQRDLDIMAKFSADEAGRELEAFYRTFKDILRKYNNL